MGRIADFAQQNENDQFQPVIDMQSQEEQPTKSRISQFANMNNDLKNSEEEDWPMWFTRTALQIPKGIAQAATYGLDIAQQIGYADATDPEEIDRIRQASERSGIPFDEEAYLEKANEAAGMFPTIANASRYAEENYGIPLEAKTGFQKFVNFASSAGKIAPKGSTLRPLNVSLPKPILGTGVAATAEGLKLAGVPEPLADIASFGILKKPPPGSPSLNFGVKSKPSGLTERKFENLNKPTQISESGRSKIHKQVESEVRDLTEKIIETTPLHETRKGLTENFRFKEEASKAFNEVHTLSKEMPGTISKDRVISKIDKFLDQNPVKGFALSEYEKSLGKNLEQFKKDIVKDNIRTVDLVDQYRKNNHSFGQLTEPGQSFAYNQAKRDALLQTNRVVAEIIDEMHPGSQLSRMFKETNERWSRIMDSEAIDNFLGDLFKGKIDFKAGRDFFGKKGIKQPLQKALGKDGFAQFEMLMNDMMSYEQGHRLLTHTSNSAEKELIKGMGAYIMHPKLGAAKFGWSALKGGYKTIYEMFLRQPKIGIIWDRGVNAAKRGNIKAAKTEFAKVKKVQEEVEAVKPSEILTESKKPKQKPSETIQGKGERIKPSPESVQSNPTENINTAFDQMGKGIVDNLYNGIFESMEKGKSTFAGMKEPLIQKAKPFYDAGLIKNAKDLREFSNNPKPFQEKLSKSQTNNPPIEEHKGNDYVQERIQELRKVESEKPVESKRAQPENRLLEHKSKVIDSPKKIEEKIHHAAEKPDITKKGLKGQKEFILDRIGDALANPSSYGEKVEINVPGDGKFKINNIEKVLNQFKKDVEKKWPDKPMKEPKKKPHVNYPATAHKEYEIGQKKALEKHLKEVEERSKIPNTPRIRELNKNIKDYEKKIFDKESAIEHIKKKPYSDKSWLDPEKARKEDIQDLITDIEYYKHNIKMQKEMIEKEISAENLKNLTKNR